MVEDIAAAMYRVPGARVETRVRLDPLGGVQDRRQQREIDVLLTIEVPGLPMPFKVAIECKNEAEPIEPEYIDAFAGKLDDVGLPRQHGIFVSTSQYSSGAIRRAERDGIRTLVLKENAIESLPEQVIRTLQSIVYVLLTVLEFTVATDGFESEAGIEVLKLADRDLKFAGTPLDIIWSRWLSGEPEMTLGDYEVEYPIPEGIGHYVSGLFIPGKKVLAKLHVGGLLIGIQGEPTGFSLMDAKTKRVDRTRVELKFKLRPGTYRVTAVSSEDDLYERAKAMSPLSIPILKFRLPRISFNGVYWPPSESTAIKLAALTRAHKAGRISDLSAAMQSIEGTDMRAILEPIWSGYPRLDRLRGSASG